MASTIENYGNIAWKRIKYNGVTHTLSEWSKVLGINYHVLRMRYKRGHRGESLFSKPQQLRTTIEQINLYINQMRQKGM